MENIEEYNYNLSTLSKKEIFSPIKLSSPKSYQGKNLTGNTRHIRDLTADIHANIQQWNNFHVQGIIILRNIIQEKYDKSYSEILLDLCEELEKICDSLDDIVKNLNKICHQLKTIAALQKTADKLFVTWPITKFGEITEVIYKAYYEEAVLKRKILENVAHGHTRSWKIFHLAGWEHQPSLSANLITLLESLLIETGHRTF